MKKTADATADVIGDKIADKRTSISKLQKELHSKKLHSKTDKNEIEIVIQCQSLVYVIIVMRTYL